MKQERREAIDKLREWIRPGDTIYTILRHVSRSGMQRAISPLLLIDGNTPDSEIPRLQAAPLDVSKWAATALGCRIGREHYGVRISGGGMDMGAHLVYELSARLFPAGYGCIGEKCQSNEHSNGDRDYTPHTAKDARAITWTDRTEPDAIGSATGFGESVLRPARVRSRL